MKYRKIKTLSTKIENVVDDICARLDAQGFRYERFNNYIPRYVYEDGNAGELHPVENTAPDVGTGYAWIKYYYEDRKFGYIFVCCHRTIGCGDCSFDRYITVYNYTDDIADSSIPGDTPILAVLPTPSFPESSASWDDTTLYYETVPFTPILSAGDSCDVCNGTGGIECTACDGEGIVEFESKVAGKTVIASATCTECDGKGYKKTHHTCPTCDGSGEIRVTTGIDTETMRPTYGYKICETCNGIGYLNDYCPECSGTGADPESILFGHEHSAYYFRLGANRNEHGIPKLMTTYPKTFTPILDKSQISKLDNSVYVMYNPDAVVDSTHNSVSTVSPTANEWSAANEINYLEFYVNDETENMSDVPVKTNIITEVESIERAVTNYAEHCIIKTYPSFEDIDSVMDFVLYKGLNRPILPTNDDINYACKSWNIDYSFIDGSKNNFQLTALGDNFIGCDYTSFDVSGSDGNTTSAFYFNGEFYISGDPNDTSGMFYDINLPANSRGNLPFEIYKIDDTHKPETKRIIIDNKDTYVAGDVLISNFIATSGGVTGDAAWSAFNDSVTECCSGTLSKLVLDVGYITDYVDRDCCPKFNSIKEVELTYKTVEVKSDSNNTGLEIDPDSDIVDEATDSVIKTYNVWDSNYKISIADDNGDPIKISNEKAFTIGVLLKYYYIKDGVEYCQELNSTQYVPRYWIHFNPTVNLIAVQNISEGASKELSFNTMTEAFSIPYINYNYDNFYVCGASASNLPSIESCYNLYWPEYGSNINAFKWYTFSGNNIDISKPDTYELHDTYNSKYFNFITEHKLKGIYYKEADYANKSPASIYNAFRVTCPTCSGNLVDSYSARCRSCAGSRVKSRYYYYECNEFRDATVYDDTGHAPIIDLDTAFPTIDDAQKVIMEDGSLSAYLPYAAAAYYNRIEGMEGYADACELVKYNTVLYKFNGDVNKYYWWDGTKHIPVSMGYKFIYRTKVVTKDCLILQDPTNANKCIPGSKSMNFNTMEVLYDDNLVLYRVLAKLEDVDNTIGFYGYNMDKKQYERIYMYNRHVFNLIKSAHDEFNYFDIESTIIDMDNHEEVDENGNYLDPNDVDYGEHDDSDTTTLKDLNEKYYYKYKSKGMISFDNLNFEVDQDFIKLS